MTGNAWLSAITARRAVVVLVGEWLLAQVHRLCEPLPYRAIAMVTLPSPIACDLWRIKSRRRELPSQLSGVWSGKGSVD